jgi:hypothetical protein
LLTLQSEAKGSTYPLWDLTTDAIGRDVSAVGGMTLGRLFTPGADRYFRRNGLWPEGEELPPPIPNESFGPPHPLLPKDYCWPVGFRQDGAVALCKEAVYQEFHGARFHLRDEAGQVHPLLEVRRAYAYEDARGALSADGRLAAMSCHEEPTVIVWDLDARQQVSQLVQSGAVKHLSFAGADRLVVVGGKTVRLWDPRQARLLAKLATFRKNVRAVAVSPDHRLFAVGNGEGSVHLWESATGNARGAFDWGVGEIGSVAFSPDGSTAAVAGQKGVVIWDVD